MTVSMEFFLVLVVNILSAGIFLGGLGISIKFIEQQIKRLEDKQDKHNGLIERMVVVEQSNKSAHKRIDAIERGY